MKYVETGARRNGKTTRAWVLLRNAIANYKRVVVVGYTGQLAEFYLTRLRQNEINLDRVHFISSNDILSNFESKLKKLGISNVERPKTLFLFDEVRVSDNRKPLEEAYVAKMLAYIGIENYIYVSEDFKKKWQYSIDGQECIVVEEVALPNASGYETEYDARKAGVCELTRRLIQTKTKFEQLSKSVEVEMMKIAG